MVTNYQRGRRAEWQVRRQLEAQGYTVVRSAGSKSPIDLVAIGSTEVRLIQVKTRIDNLRDLTISLSNRFVSLPPFVSLEIWLRDKRVWKITRVW